MRKGIWLAAIAMLFALPQRAVAQQGSQSAPPQSAAKTQAQGPGQTAAKPDPLVEAARKNREAQKTAPKAATVFTNDNIPTTPGAVSVVGNESPAGGENATSGKASATTSNGEAAWRKKFADARHKLQQDQQELSILQRESGQLQVQYYPDPTKALMQSVNRSDIAKKAQAIADKQKQIDADRQAISNLEDELRKAGGDPGWARE